MIRFAIIPLPPSSPLGVPVLCTLLVETLLEEPEKLIRGLMVKTLQSIASHNFPNN